MEKKMPFLLLGKKENARIKKWFFVSRYREDKCFTPSRIRKCCRGILLTATSHCKLQVAMLGLHLLQACYIVLAHQSHQHLNHDDVNLSFSSRTQFVIKLNNHERGHNCDKTFVNNHDSLFISLSPLSSSDKSLRIVMRFGHVTGMQFPTMLTQLLFASC